MASSTLFGRALSARFKSIFSLVVLASVTNTNLSRNSSISWISSYGILSSPSSSLSSASWSSISPRIIFSIPVVFPLSLFLSFTPLISLAKNPSPYIYPIFFLLGLESALVPLGDWSGVLGLLLGLYLAQASIMSCFPIVYFSTSSS